MTDTHLQALYDILKDAFEGGIAYGKDTEGRGRTAGDILFPLAARMEEVLKQLVEEEQNIVSEEVWARADERLRSYQESVRHELQCYRQQNAAYLQQLTDIASLQGPAPILIDADKIIVSLPSSPERET